MEHRYSLTEGGLTVEYVSSFWLCYNICSQLYIGDPSTERFVLSFTLRDSPVDFINVSCWGGEQFINDLANQFHIGQVGTSLALIGFISILYQPKYISIYSIHAWNCVDILGSWVDPGQCADQATRWIRQQVQAMDFQVWNNQTLPLE